MYHIVTVVTVVVVVVAKVVVVSFVYPISRLLVRMSTPFHKLLEGLVQIDDQRWTLVTKQEVCLGRRLCPALPFDGHFISKWFMCIFFPHFFRLRFRCRFRLSNVFAKHLLFFVRSKRNSSEEMDLPRSRRIY